MIIKNQKSLLEMLNKITGLEISVIHDNKPNRSVEHPTMKPVTLCAKLIYNSSMKEILYLTAF